MERFGGCWGRAFGVLYIDFGDQRSVVGSLLGCWGVPEGALEVLGGTLGSFGCLLGGPWASLGALGMSWERPGVPWCDFGVLGRSLGES